MGRKFDIHTEDGIVKATKDELRNSCSTFQWEIWTRTRTSAQANDIDFFLKPTDFSKVRPVWCSVLHQEQIKKPEDLIVMRKNTNKPYDKSNIRLVSRRAYNALNANLDIKEWAELLNFVIGEYKKNSLDMEEIFDNCPEDSAGVFIEK